MRFRLILDEIDIFMRFGFNPEPEIKTGFGLSLDGGSVRFRCILLSSGRRVRSGRWINLQLF